jgi:hypothetical protein
MLDRFATDGLLSPQLEKKGILGPTIGRRPGDVTVPIWREGKGLAIDVAVTCPLQKKSVRVTDPCEDYAAIQKHGKYDKDFQGTDYLFCAMVWETLGAVNAEGEEVLRQIFRFAAKRLGKEFSSFCGRAWARVSCCLQRCVSQSILLRIDGLEFSTTSPVTSLSSSVRVAPACATPTVLPPLPPPLVPSSPPTTFPPPLPLALVSASEPVLPYD